MEPPRWEEIEAAFSDLVALDAGARRKRLAALGATDPALRAAVEKLLAADAAAETRLAPLASSLLAPAVDPLDRLAAALAGRYRVERELGHGGMATVYLAHDLKHDRPVALKVLKPELAAALGRERFLREVALTARLDHPHIVPLLDSGEAGGLVYYVMPYVEGESLRDRLEREKQLSLEDALQITHEVADALDYAHGHGIIHRDIKPANILLGGGHARVADFGIARAVTAAGGATLTETGIAVGTPAYMSPEQATAERDVDARSDVYSLACVVYEMLAGQPPYTGATPEAILARRAVEAVPSLRIVRAAVPAGMEKALTRGLAKVPADRFATASAFATALHNATIEQRPLPPRRILQWFLVVGAIAAILAGVVVLAVRSHEQRRLATVPVVRHTRTAIAVLPFQNLSEEMRNTYFAIGLHEELLTQLAKVASLKVIGRTSVMDYANTTKLPKQIATELGVEAIVEASVQVLGTRLRVNAHLVDATTDDLLWAEHYDRTLDDAFAVQSDIAQQIVAAVGATLSRAEVAAITTAPTQDAEAYRLYLQGEEYRIRPGQLRQNLESAEQLYERALKRDSTFALAYASLSNVQSMLFTQGYDRHPRRLERARMYADAALRFDPRLLQAHWAMGQVYYYGARDYGRALREFTFSTEALQGSADLQQYVGFVHRRMGHWHEALAAFEQARTLNPRNAEIFWDLGAFTLRLLHRYEDAIAANNRALELAPDLAAANTGKAQDYILWMGRLDTLRVQLARGPQDYGVDGSALEWQANLALWERQPDSVLIRVSNSGPRVFEGQFRYKPSLLLVAWAHRLRGDSLAAAAALQGALRQLDSTLLSLPDDWRVHMSRSVALAALGREAEARREADWLTHTGAYTDAVIRSVVSEGRAIMFAQLGRAQEAVTELEPLFVGPSLTSAPLVRLDPRYDPIRKDHRFQALLAKYANPQPIY